MSLTVTAGTYSSGTTDGSPDPSYPVMTINSGDKALCVVHVHESGGTEDFNNSENGWTLLVKKRGNTQTAGTDTGPCWTAWFEKTMAGGETGNINGQINIVNNVAGTTGTSAFARIFIVQRSGGTAFGIGTASGTDDSTGTSFSVTMDANPGIEEGSVVFKAWTIPTDTLPTWGTDSFTATGVTFGAETSLASQGVAAGRDCGGYSAYHTVSAGPATAAISWSTTLSGTTTNASGPAAIVRIWEQTDKSDSDSATVTDSEQVSQEQTDSLSVSETEQINATLDSTDSASITDTEQIAQEQTDALSVTDTEQISQEQTDTLSVTDTEQISQEQTDTLSVTDAEQISQEQTDSVSFTETQDLLVNISDTDSLSFTESESIDTGGSEVQKSDTDALSVTETELLEQLQTDTLTFAETEVIQIFDTDNFTVADTESQNLIDSDSLVVTDQQLQELIESESFTISEVQSQALTDFDTLTISEDQSRFPPDGGKYRLGMSI